MARGRAVAGPRARRSQGPGNTAGAEVDDAHLRTRGTRTRCCRASRSTGSGGGEPPQSPGRLDIEPPFSFARRGSTAVPRATYDRIGDRVPVFRSPESEHRNAGPLRFEH
ncbi:hypothetical protein Kpho02_06510 [Kitasatospora phosalacinea]|uniref:Uncharacterized protein n=1 Tax=Kitasatospora phosalacinea TaxID=2065 RepID=A0A9W6Q550_9ACTN|nr:hypothetical protein Kpho02_06510 [Kitasatospora phosalacinea]